MSLMPPDAAARERIEQDLQSNLMVEAGAGSGKTTALVGRLLQHVRTGTPVEQLAAVTFTRKAADELRERFQLRLEEVARSGATDDLAAARCATALRDLDRAFLGTIHSFCARLLRERPIEVGLDPQFEEIADADVEPMNREFWRRWIDTMRREDDADVAALQACRIDAASLHGAFATVMQYHDVDFSAPPVALPDPQPAMRALAALVDRAEALRAMAPASGRLDDLMKLHDRLRFHRSVNDWGDAMTACRLLETLRESQVKATQLVWADTPAGKKDVKALESDFLQFLADVAAPVVRQWREYRYPVVMRVLQRAVADYAHERHTRGTLGFDDLLALCAQLLRDHPTVREELGLRYRYLLVDEFQDTDPVQAEVCLLLASEPAQGNDWQTVTPRPGALFVVGDPKQSIYRFRRADIQIYERVKARFEQFGASLALTANFRSTHDIGALVNTAFAPVFPAQATPVQAAFSPLETVQEPSPTRFGGVHRYVVACASRRDADLVTQDAEQVAAWIAARIAEGELPGSFLILTEKKWPIAAHARALAERNIAVTTTGATLTQEFELAELMVVLRALADPGNPVLVAAALEGLFFGLTPADLFAARQAQVAFSIATPVTAPDGPVGSALLLLHRWWEYSQRQPADVLLERIYRDTGLLALAAGSVLGDSRAGALLHLVEIVRASAVAGKGGLPDAVAVLEELLVSESEDAPLRPGRTDAVRVMNLHKAKGLEADIVILASPTDRHAYEPYVHVTRAATGRATGGLLIVHGNTRLAQPVGWDDMQVQELAFAASEEDRLRYVAATRARRALVVGQATKPGKTPKPDASMWRAFADTLDALQAPTLAAAATEPSGRVALELSIESFSTAVTAASDRVTKAAEPSLRVATVTGSVKGADAGDEPPPASMRGEGRAWGTAVHRCLDAMVRGRRDARLDAFVAAVVADEGLPESDAARLRALLAQVRASTAWQEVVAMGALTSELAVMHARRDGDVTDVTEGVIDLAAAAPDGWRVVDWKSDVATGDEWARRLVQYSAQVERYAALLQDITGRSARATIERVGQG